jgi:hypothetical protein
LKRLHFVELEELLEAVADEVDVPWTGEDGAVAVFGDLVQIVVPLSMLCERVRVLPNLNLRVVVKLEFRLIA